MANYNWFWNDCGVHGTILMLLEFCTTVIGFCFARHYFECCSFSTSNYKTSGGRLTVKVSQTSQLSLLVCLNSICWVDNLSMVLVWTLVRTYIYKGGLVSSISDFKHSPKTIWLQSKFESNLELKIQLINKHIQKKEQ